MNVKEPKMNFENLGAIQAEIDYLEENVPRKSEKSVFKEHKERLSYLRNLYNMTSDAKMYKLDD